MNTPTNSNATFLNRKAIIRGETIGELEQLVSLMEPGYLREQMLAVIEAGQDRIVEARKAHEKASQVV